MELRKSKKASFRGFFEEAKITPEPARLYKATAIERVQ